MDLEKLKEADRKMWEEYERAGRREDLKMAAYVALGSAILFLVSYFSCP